MKAISGLPQASVLKQGYKCQSYWYENDFYSHANETHFHNKQFAFSLILELRNGLLQTSVWKPWVYTSVSEGL